MNSVKRHKRPNSSGGGDGHRGEERHRGGGGGGGGRSNHKSNNKKRQRVKGPPKEPPRPPLALPPQRKPAPGSVAVLNRVDDGSSSDSSSIEDKPQHAPAATSAPAADSSSDSSSDSSDDDDTTTPPSSRSGGGAGGGAGATSSKQKSSDTPPKEEAAAAGPGRQYTVSIALPGSIIDNAQSPELRSYLAGQIARAAAIFCVDEVVVFSEQTQAAGSRHRVDTNSQRDPNVFLARILQYLETPQYLRRTLIPRHPDLRFAGLLNPLDTPHHMRITEVAPFREGVVVKRPCKSGAFVNVGLKKDVHIQQPLQAGVRVTAAMKNPEDATSKRKLRAEAVPPSRPREVNGTYWGYTVRVAKSVSDIFTGGEFKYDVTIGTSERGTVSVDDTHFTVPKFKHLLIVFGGVMGLEEAVDADETLQLSGKDVQYLFDMWVNTCPAQGSRTIRTEEAIPITMAALRPHIMRNTPPAS